MNTTWVDPAVAYGIARLGPRALVGGGSVIIFPELLSMEGWSRLDSMCYVSVGLTMEDRSVVCPGSQLIGGAERKITLKRWSYCGWGSILMARSESYDGLVGVGYGAPGPSIEGDIVFETFSGVAAHCEVFPGVTLPEGAVVGVGSMVHDNKYLEPWALHWGRPAKPVRKRDRDRVLREAETAERGRL